MPFLINGPAATGSPTEVRQRMVPSPEARTTRRPSRVAAATTLAFAAGLPTISPARSWVHPEGRGEVARDPGSIYGNAVEAAMNRQSRIPPKNSRFPFLVMAGFITSII